jgi:hypothetical protein
MNTDQAFWAQPVFMDSGLAASRRPGMTPEGHTVKYFAFSVSRSAWKAASEPW